MDKKSFLTLLEKHLKGKTNQEEDRFLRDYFNSFQEGVSDQWPEELGDRSALKEKMLGRLSRNIAKEPSRNSKVKSMVPNTWLKYAASAAVFIVALFLFQYYQSTTGSKISVQDKANAIVLKLDNGNVDVISENDQKKITDSKGNVVGYQKGNTIAYEPQTSPKELVYNELTVPLGKRFDLVLSDGTAVKLNAGSTIKYPVQFVEGNPREVEIWGEAYFDVTKDPDHPFLVNTNSIQVKVLGTKFNVSSYPEDNHISTVLVEGSVQLSAKDTKEIQGSIVIAPNEKASWNKITSKMSVSEVDTDIYTSWINGRIVFKNTPFKNIRKKLERRYNVSIINHNTSLDEKFYNASFDIETIEEVMDAFKENYAIDYTLSNNEIIINEN